MSDTAKETVYTFDELSDSAKERAIQDYRNKQEVTAEDMEYVIDDAVEVGRLLGISISGREWTNSYGNSGSTPKIYYDLYRGSIASFDGEYDYQKGAPKEIRSYAPNDKVLHGIADGLQALQKRHFYQLRAAIDTSFLETDISVTVSRNDYKEVSEETEEWITQLMRDFAGWIHTSLRREYEYILSDEAIRENIIANDYLFNEDGEQAN